MALDFSLLGKGPQFENVLASFNAGRDDRVQKETKNALAQYGTDPEGAIASLTRIDPSKGMQLQNQYTTQKADQARKAVFQTEDKDARYKAAIETGDPETIRAVQGMDTVQRAQAKEKTEAIGGFVHGLLTRVKDPVARKQAITEMAPNLEAAGFTPEQIANFDPTDENLSAILAKTQSLDTLLAMDKADDGPKAPSGFRYTPDGERLEPIPGYVEGVGQISGVRRDAVVSRPMPKAAGSGRGRGGSAPKPPAGFVLD